MTKANLKEMYKNWNREITTACTNDDTLKRLQDLNEEKRIGRKTLFVGYAFNKYH